MWEQFPGDATPVPFFFDILGLARKSLSSAAFPFLPEWFRYSYV